MLGSLSASEVNFMYKNGRYELPYVVKSHFRALRACGTCGTCERIYISTKSFAWLTLRLFFTVQVSKRPLGADLCSKKHIFAICGRAACAGARLAGIRSCRCQCGSNEVSHTRTHPHTAQIRSTLRYLYIV